MTGKSLIHQNNPSEVEAMAVALRLSWHDHSVATRSTIIVLSKSES